MRFWPRQDIPETKKDMNWYKQHLEYAVFSFQNNRTKRVQKMNLLQGYYNGIIPESNVAYLTKTFGGKRNLGKFIPYGIGKSKIDRMCGDFLDMPQNSTVMTINPVAMDEKMRNYHIQIGLKQAADEVTKLRDVVGADPFDGMPIPKDDGDDFVNFMSMKNTNEYIMQTAVNEQYKQEDLKTKFTSNFLDVLMWAEAFGKIEINSNGDTKYREIDPRNALYEESDRDPFLTQTPYIGEYRNMFIHDIIMELPELDESQRAKLDQIKGSNYQDLITKYPNYYSLIGESLAIAVYSIEWKSLRPVITKEVPDRKNPKNKPYRKDINPEFYEKNKDKIDKDVFDESGFIRTKWKVDIHEATQIGHDMTVRCRRKLYQPRQFSRPGETMYGYVGLNLLTRDGKRTSLWELTNNLSFLYDTVMFQINREIAKAKGKVVMYDKAFLPAGMKMDDVLYDMSNNSVYVMDSSQEGNKYQKDIVVQGGIKEIDLGISSIIQTLLPLKAEIKNTLDQLTGINEAREGSLPASTTATNGQQSLQASRLSTKSIFYYMNRYCENVLTSVCEHTKISWGILNPDRARMIIGDAGVKFLKAGRGLTMDDYATFIFDGFREMKIRETINRLAEASLNTKELRMHDVLDVELAETMSEARARLEKGWEQVQKIQQQSQEQQMQAQQQQQEMSRKMAIEDREDKQANAVQIALIEAHAQGAMEAQKASNELVNKQADAEMQDDADTAKMQMGYKKGKK